jgi:hypothetical protein
MRLPRHKNRGKPCKACGRVHANCLGHNKHPYPAGVLPCPQKPRPGNEVCDAHGALTPRGKEKTEKFMANLARNQEVAKFLHQMKVEPIGDPMVALEKAVAEAGALYEFWRDRVGQMEPDSMRWRTDMGMEQLRSETLLMERAHERYMKGLEILQKLKRAADDKGGDTILDLIKAGLADR